MKSHGLSSCLPGRAILRGRVPLLVAVAVVLAVSGFAKMYERPRSFALEDQSLEKVQVKVMPKVDVERLKAEDREREKDLKHPGPKRFAVGVKAAFTLENSGTWQNLPDGRLWRLRIQSPGAKSHNLGFTRYEMPEGAKLWVYDPSHKHVEGPYTSANRSPAGSLWTPVIEGDEIVIEVFVPTGVAMPGIELTRVNQGYYGGQAGLFGASEGTCEVDVICTPQGDPWRDQIRAVAVFTISNDFGSGACTGTLLNDIPQDHKNYFLTANHCLENNGDPASVVLFWNFESPTCGTHGPGSTADSQTGSSLRANSAASDFALLELTNPPDPGFHVFYAGWDATGVAPASTVVIHHPEADVKAISFSNSAPDSGDWTGLAPTGGTLDPAGNHWHVVWDVAGTEAGSSGGCLFRTDTKRCIGQNHGGEAACSVTHPENFYGKFSVSWTGGGTNATRLSNWLDPGSTGTLTNDGDPHIITANGVHYNFQGAGEYVSLLNDSGLEIQTREAAIATTSGPLADGYDGVATCVSLNTAVAARVGRHRVTYEPNLSGVPDPSGLQLRVDGALTTLGPGGLNLAGGGRILKTAAPGGLEVDFPDSNVLLVTPGWWSSQSKWYLDVHVVHGAASDGIGGGARGSGPRGLMGVVPEGSWLPSLPDGTPMGLMPAAVHQRYLDLYQKFGDAWRVTDKSSLFDYAPGTSTATFTMPSWPAENPPSCMIRGVRPARPVGLGVAERACRPVSNKNAHADCVFDVRVTGNVGFAKTYIESQRVKPGKPPQTEVKAPDR